MTTSANVPGDEPPPPYTPSDSSSLRQPQQLPQQQSPPQASQPVQHPPPRASQSPSRLFTYAISIKPNTRGTELVFPSHWAPQHDVNPQDWNSFTEALIPDSALSSGASDEKCLSYQRKKAIESVIKEWNDTFFERRGVKITFEEYLSRSQQPQHQQQQQQSEASSSTSYPPARAHFESYPDTPVDGPPHQFHQQQFQQNHHRPSFPTHLPPNPNGNNQIQHSMSTRQRWTKKLKKVAHENDVSVTGEQIRVGNIFTVDATKIQIGKLNLNDKGVQYGGKPVGPQVPQQHGYNPAPQSASAQMYGYGRYGPPGPGYQGPAGYYGGQPPMQHGQPGWQPQPGYPAQSVPGTVPHPGSWNHPSPSSHLGPPQQLRHSASQPQLNDDFAPPPGPPPTHAVSATSDRKSG